MKRLLIKLLGESLIKVAGGIDTVKMDAWLVNSVDSGGFKNYNTLRKKAITNIMSIGVEEKEYWTLIGRLKELDTLNDNIRKAIKKRSKENKVEIIREKELKN